MNLKSELNAMGLVLCSGIFSSSISVPVAPYHFGQSYLGEASVDSFAPSFSQYSRSRASVRLGGGMGVE